MPDVRHAIAADLPELTDTLTSAFAKDPVMCWMFQDPEQRPAQLESWMRFSLGMGITRGHLYGVDGNRGAAIWSPPDTTLFDAFWVPKMIELLTDLIGDRTAAVIEALGKATAAHPKDESHFYLFTLGTRADAQGEGLGSRILRPVLDICDAQGLAATLESSNPKNLPFYERHGFEITAEIELEKGGPVVRPMHRTPR
jgi:ribosomal protein S18 acetylase RimI-like enzyme